jgi:hypothetical protein
MLLQFTVTADDSLWICDVQFLNWARVSAPGSDPISTVLESGKLIPQGFGVYSFEGRRPDTPGPGAGICSVGTYLVGLGNTIKIYIRTNVPIKDFTMPAPIRQILYEILPTDPKQIESSIQEIANGQAAESSGSEKSEVSGQLPETTSPTEQPEAETSVESDGAEVDPSPTAEIGGGYVRLESTRDFGGES